MREMSRKLKKVPPLPVARQISKCLIRSTLVYEWDLDQHPVHNRYLCPNDEITLFNSIQFNLRAIPEFDSHDDHRCCRNCLRTKDRTNSGSRKLFSRWKCRDLLISLDKDIEFLSMPSLFQSTRIIIVLWGWWDIFEAGHPIRLDHDPASLRMLTPEVLHQRRTNQQPHLWTDNRETTVWCKARNA
jgi:hypothetical protein